MGLNINDRFKAFPYKKTKEKIWNDVIWTEVQCPVCKFHDYIAISKLLARYPTVPVVCPKCNTTLKIIFTGKIIRKSKDFGKEGIIPIYLPSICHYKSEPNKKK